MINALRLMASLSLALTLHSYAGTLDEIRQLEAGKTAGASAPVAQQYLHPDADTPVTPDTATPGSTPAATPRWFHLSDGRRVNISDWKVVLFLQSSCQYCHRFDPVLQAFSQQTGLSVFPFSLDGKGDNTYPQVLPATPDVVVDFFKGGIPIATPTTFLTNIHTMETYPLLQGAVDGQALQARVDEVLRLALSRHQRQPVTGRVGKVAP
ncbi:type-F conjugative transfer system pilin assembly thiol-disulfide isomerase TrbB [Scandinavium goeteborgense]|uniref:Type-F conjugative transfer system pilin assembly thiol-disulfide isomerase TrbB n=1 Tax=Scandinavium goeteborgense TaxID=1851514 RepID=A0A4R6E188_SCAGO|nr:type-F conjugative transfer system pilin assembly thiol-disulfide isomerase TrbB [Scandinavium goeteborgense]TDN51486.1 type-F conjugative transfer system pilin assembly thiol-disulfide isomerase TrbB [Scandinavium goeteborgense]